jgi:hypothetical protein
MVIISLKIGFMIGLPWILPLINVAMQWKWLDVMSNLLISLQGTVIFFLFIVTSSNVRQRAESLSYCIGGHT